MAKFPAIVTTTQGLNIISAALAAGKSIVFTRLCVGDGTTETAFADLTGMVNICLQLGATSADNIGNGHYVIHATLDNSTVDTGFYCRELGVYAKVEGEDADQLFAYTNAGSECDFIPDKSYPIDSQVFNVDLLIGNDAAITLIRSDETYVSVADIENHNTDPTAHAAGIAGNAATATALETSRTIRTDLSSTSAASFDGTANVTPGVTGVLPVANGGTGSSVEKYLPLAGGTMTGNIHMGDDVAKLYFGNSFLRSNAETTGTYTGIYLEAYSSDNSRCARLILRSKNSTSATGVASLIACDGTNTGELDLYPNGLMSWNGTSVKLGTSTIGGAAIPVYLNAGTPTACTSLSLNTTGNAATATKLGTSTVGGTAKPIYLKSGSPTACSYGGISAQSLGRSGYVKFNDGFIIQWGYATASGNYADVTFSTAFSSASSYSAFATDVLSSSATSPSASVTIQWSVGASSATTARFLGSNMGLFAWIAIGK